MSLELSSKESQINFKMRESSKQWVYNFENFRLDAEHLLLFRDGEQIKLTPKVVETLLVLIEHEGEIVSKDELMRSLWPDTVVEESNLSQNLYLLRKALGSNANGDPFVETLRRRGYRFCGDVSYARSLTTGNSESARPIRIERSDNIYAVADWNPGRTEKSAERPQRSPWFLAVIILMAFAAVSALGFAIFRGASGSADQKNVPVPFYGRSVERLTTSGLTKRGALSPDGRYLAHMTESSDGGSLWIRQVSSSTDVPIAGPLKGEVVWIGFGNDSESVYYLSLDRDKGDTELFRVPALGGPPVLAAYDTGPVGFSPDGGSIAFVRNYKDESRLVIADANGLNERVVSSKSEPAYFSMMWNAPAWSPDGKTVACPVGLSDASGSYETLIGIDVGTGNDRPLTTKRWKYVGQPNWRGNAIMLTAAERTSSPKQIWHISAENGAATRITQDLNEYSDLSLTSDGSQLGAMLEQISSAITVGPSRINGEQKQIVTEAGVVDEIAWTPDGRMAYVSNAGGGEIWIVNSDGSNKRQLTTGAIAVCGLTVSPDGRYIVFSAERTGTPNLWRIAIDGSDLTQLTSGQSEMYPQFTADGEWIIFQRDLLNSTLWKIRIDGTDSAPFVEQLSARPAVSPDGKFVAYKYLDSSFERSRWSIGIFPAEGGQQTARFDFPANAAERFVRFTPDSQNVAFATLTGGSSDIWLQSLAGGSPKRSTTFNAPNITAFEWSRNGKDIAVLRQTSTRGVVMLTTQK